MILRKITPQFLQFILQSPILSFDTETTGVNVRKDQIIGFSVSNGIESYYVVHQEWNGTQLAEVASKQSCINAIRWLLSRKLIMHNGSFDCRITKQYFGIDLANSLYADTMLMAHTVNENRFNYGLKELGADVFGNNEKEAQTALKEHLKQRGAGQKEFYKADSEIMGTYAVQDAMLTYKLWQYFEPMLAEDGLTAFFYNDEVMPLYTLVTIPMETAGIPVDVPYLQQTQTELHAVMEKLHEEIQADIAPFLTPFNEWFINYKYPFELNVRFKQKLGEFIAPELWPKSTDGKLSFSVAAITKVKQHTKTEIKKGTTRPLLQDSDFEKIITGKMRCPKDLITKTQLALIAEDGITHPFNILSKDHLKRLLFGTSTTASLLKEIPLSTTPTGLPQVDDDFLQHIAHKYAWVPKLQRFNSLTKLKSTYVDRFLEQQEDGIFYPAWFQHRTTSGRFAGDFQQLPRISEDKDADPVVKEYNNRIRRFFISGPNHTFADFDFDSQEVKVFAHVSNEPAIKQIFEANEDFYSAVCIKAENLQGYSANKKADNYLGKINKTARQRAKAYALGLAFNMSPYKLKFELNCSEQEAQHIYDNYFRSYPQLKKWLDASKEKGIRQGYIRLESGRLRRVPELPSLVSKWGMCLFDGLELWKEYNEDGQQYIMAKQAAKVAKNLLNNICNVQIQGLAASISNRSAIATAKTLKKAGLKAYICAVIHDQITVNAPDNELEQVCNILKECMENTYPLSILLTAPSSWGKNLAESK